MTAGSVGMMSDKCHALMRQSKGSCESVERTSMKPVLNRINKFLVHAEDQSPDPFLRNSHDVICEISKEDEDIVEEMSFRSRESPHSRSFIHTPSRHSDSPKVSIKDRLAALQDSSEQGWRSRLPPKVKDAVVAAASSSPCLAWSPSAPSPPPSSSSSVTKKPIGASASSDLCRKVITSSTTEDNISLMMTPKMRDKQSISSECIYSGRDGSNLNIASRLSQLAESKDRWMERSPREGQDAAKFTVAGKMRRLGVDGETSLAITKKPTVRPVTMIELNSKQDVEGEESDAPREPKVVKIPKMDDDLFFKTFKSSNIQLTTSDEKLHFQDDLVVVVGDVNLAIDSDTVLPFMRKIRPRRNNKGSTNPLKTRSMVIETTDQYLQVRTGVANLEKKRIEKEQIVGQTQLAQDALAGLASKENFDQVVLRKGGLSRILSDNQKPFKDLMLIHVKGRRICQARLVEPCMKSFNSGDCFVLVTPDVVYLWSGKFSNVIERAKAQDFATQIVEKHDMGVKSSCQLLTIDEEKQTNTKSAAKLWMALGLSDDDLKNCPVGEPGPNEEDELFEAGVVSTNRVYRLDDENQMSLVPEYSGVVLQCSILQHSECLIFDFGSEMYAWSGKNVSLDRRRKTVAAALRVWNDGFDYTEHLLNPIHPLSPSEDKKGSVRPSWCIFGKVSQNLETLLFREKFVDWPDAFKIIKTKDQSLDKSEVIIDLLPCDVDCMLKTNLEKSSLMLEGYHIGRGLKWEESIDGILWEHEMVTSELDVWQVGESGKSKLPLSSYGLFNSGDTYVIRWKYRINQITRNLKGEISKRDLVSGRSRCAYFFWQGVLSTINEKGASALLTIELNQDHGVHVRVVQGKEPSCFIGLFSSSPMFVYFAAKSSKTRRKSDVIPSKFEFSQSGLTKQPSSDETGLADGGRKLFMLRNELPEDTYFLEVDCTSSSLRSRTSFLLAELASVDSKPGRLMIWHGCKAPKRIRSRILELTTLFVKKHHPEGLDCSSEAIQEVEEGSEPPSFCELLGTELNRKSYSSLLLDDKCRDHTPRLFHFVWTSGVFETEEIRNPTSSGDLGVPSPFPFHQSDVYSAAQPALFLLDDLHDVFLWQGWWPQSSDDCFNVQTGSANSKFIMARKCAMQTSINYCLAKNPSSPPDCHLVHAGREPPTFTSLFPTWSVYDEALMHAEQNNLESEPKLVSDAFSILNRSTYTWSELQERPLPDGVDPLKLETYLDDPEFQTIMGMTKTDFIDLPQWKQTNLKRKSGLF